MRKNKLQTDEIDKLRDMDKVANKIQSYKDKGINYVPLN